MVHTISCFYFGVGKISRKISPNGSNWLETNNMLEKTWIDQYLTCFYLMAALLMGEGIYTLPQNQLETIFYIFILICTVISSALIISTMGSILTDYHKDKEKYNTEVQILNRYMRKKKLSIDLQVHQIYNQAIVEQINNFKQLRSRNYLQYLYKQNDQTTSYEESLILQKLSKSLYDEIHTQAFIDMLDKLSMFKEHFSQAVLGQLIFALEEVKYSHNELINFTDEERSIIIIKEGELQVYYDSFEKGGPILQVDDMFGELEFFTGIRPCYYAKSNGLSIVYRIQRKKFVEILNNYPEDLEKFNYLRDLLQFEKNFTDYRNITCFICKDNQHQFYNCSKIHCVSDINKIISESRISPNQQRERYRRNDVYFQTLSKVHILQQMYTLNENHYFEQHKYLQKIREESNELQFYPQYTYSSSEYFEDQQYSDFSSSYTSSVDSSFSSQIPPAQIDQHQLYEKQKTKKVTKKQQSESQSSSQSSETLQSQQSDMNSLKSSKNSNRYQSKSKIKRKKTNKISNFKLFKKPSIDIQEIISPAKKNKQYQQQNLLQVNDPQKQNKKLINSQDRNQSKKQTELYTMKRIKGSQKSINEQQGKKITKTIKCDDIGQLKRKTKKYSRGDFQKMTLKQLFCLDFNQFQKQNLKYRQKTNQSFSDQEDIKQENQDISQSSLENQELKFIEIELDVMKSFLHYFSEGNYTVVLQKLQLLYKKRISEKQKELFQKSPMNRIKRSVADGFIYSSRKTKKYSEIGSPITPGISFSSESNNFFFKNLPNLVKNSDENSGENSVFQVRASRLTNQCNSYQQKFGQDKSELLKKYL